MFPQYVPPLKYTFIYFIFASSLELFSHMHFEIKVNKCKKRNRSLHRGSPQKACLVTLKCRQSLQQEKTMNYFAHCNSEAFEEEKKKKDTRPHLPSKRTHHVFIKGLSH